MTIESAAHHSSPAKLNFNTISIMEKMFKQNELSNNQKFCPNIFPGLKYLRFPIWPNRLDTGGKPSTWFPPGRLVELIMIRQSFFKQ